MRRAARLRCCPNWAMWPTRRATAAVRSCRASSGARASCARWVCAARNPSICSRHAACAASGPVTTTRAARPSSRYARAHAHERLADPTDATVSGSYAQWLCSSAIHECSVRALYSYSCRGRSRWSSSCLRRRRRPASRQAGRARSPTGTRRCQSPSARRLRQCFSFACSLVRYSNIRACSRPAESFLAFTSPLKTLKHIVWARFKWHIIAFVCLILLVLFVALFLYSLPVRELLILYYTLYTECRMLR